MEWKRGTPHSVVAKWICVKCRQPNEVSMTLAEGEKAMLVCVSCGHAEEAFKPLEL